MRSRNVVVVDPEDWVAEAASLVAERIRAFQESAGICTIALSGGSTPGPVYQRLAKDEDGIDWARVAVFLRRRALRAPRRSGEQLWARSQDPGGRRSDPGGVGASDPW